MIINIKNEVKKLLEEFNIKNFDINIENNCIMLNIIFNDDNQEIKLKIKEKLELNFKNYKINIIFSKLKNNSIKNNKENKIQNIQKIIFVGSGKGGVGKSTSALNLALSLSNMGWRTALLDADIYCSSIPSMLNIEDEMVKIDENNKLMKPIEFLTEQGFILKINSIGFITKSDEAIMWRGPMISKCLDQLISGTSWGDLDFLIIDTPPGTGDIHINLFLKYNIDIVFLVSHFTKSSLYNTQKTFNMIEKTLKKEFNLYSILNYLPENFNFSLSKNEPYMKEINFLDNSDVIFEIKRENNLNILCEKYFEICRKIIK